MNGQSSITKDELINWVQAVKEPGRINDDGFKQD